MKEAGAIPPSTGFIRVLRVLGWWLVIPSLLLGLEKVWEETWLTLANGPQMIWFSTVHTGIALPFFAAVLAGGVWVFVVFGHALVSKSIADRRILVELALYAVAWACILIPSGF